MKLIVKVNGEPHEVNADISGNMLTATVNGREISVEVSRPEPNAYLIREGLRVREFHTSPDRKTISIDGHDLDIEVIDPKNAPAGGSSASAADGVAEIKTAMPGKVVKVIANVGDDIASGDPVIVVEAMKMQNEMRSPKDGVVREILFSEGDTVAAGDVLAIID